MQECCLFRKIRIISVFGIILFTAASYSQTRFTEVAVAKGVPGNPVKNKQGETISAYGHGVAAVDLNNDGLPDIYISNAVRYANKLPETLYVSNGGTYSEEDQKRGIDDPYGWTGSHGICFVDYDNDGDFDLFNATTDDRNRLYQNDGNGFFRHVSDEAGLPLIRTVYPPFDSQPYGYGTRGVIAFDADNDGFMDLLGVNWGPAENRYNENEVIVIPPQPNEFYHNNGNGTFSPMDNGLTLPKNHSYMGTQGVVAGDIDLDGDVDVLIVHRNYTGKTENGQVIADFNPAYKIPNQLMINDGRGNFRDETNERRLYDPYNDANGATFTDIDNDGDLDILIPQKAKRPGLLKVYINRGDGVFGDRTNNFSINQWGFSTFVFDVDNDGDLDIVAPRTQSTVALYLNDGKGNFTLEPAGGIEAYMDDPRGGAVADFDGDGDLDLYIADANKSLLSKAGNRFFRNDLNSTNRWLRITGRGPKGDMGGFGTKIWVFEQGYLGDMTRLVGYRDVQNAYGFLCQDDPVQHFGLGQRDTVDVRVKLLDGTTLHMYSAPAKSLLFFSRPHQVLTVEGDGQTAPPNSDLPIPLKVIVKDAYGNAVYGAKVTFSSNDPTGRFVTPAVVYSRRDGTAAVRYRLGNSAQQTIRASIEEQPNNSAEFRLTAGSQSVLSLAMVSGDGQAGFPNQLLPQPLVVQVTRADGSPAPSVQVSFQVIAGEAALEPSAVVLSDLNGRAQVNVRLGSTLGSVTVQASAVGALNSPVIFHLQAVQRLAVMTMISGDGQTGYVGQLLPQPLRVQVAWSDGTWAAAQTVTFRAVSGDVSFEPAAMAVTNLQGIAEVNVRLGQTPGPIIVQAEFNPAQNSPIRFTLQALPITVLVTKLNGDEQTATVGSVLPIQPEVRVTLSTGTPVVNETVTFRVMQGGGSLDGVVSKTVVTDSEGKAKVSWTLGGQAGQQILSASAGGFTVQFTATARPDRPFRVVMSGGGNQTLIPGTIFPEPFSVQVKDRFDNVLEGIPVLFTVTQGEGHLEGERQKTVQTNINGIASVRWTPDPYLGAANVLTAAVQAEQPVLNSPIYWAFPAAEISAVNSLLTATTPVLADGTDRSVITVELRNSLNQPLGSGYTVVINSTGDGNRIIYERPITNEQSILRAFLTSTVPEPKVITARVLGANVTLKAQAVVDFQPAQQTPDRMIVLSGNAQVGVVGEPLPQPFVIKCIDIAGMPMRSCDVRFEVTDGDGHFEGQRGITVRVSGDGLASALLTLGRTAGVRTFVRVSSPGMNNSPLTLYAESRRGEASQLFIAGGDRQVGAPNTELPMPLTVQVTDRFGNPVESYPVEFSVKTGDAVVNDSRSAALQTDAQGKAQVKVKLGSQLGNVLIEARTGFSSVFFSLQTADNRPEADLQRSTLVCTSPVPADGVSRSQVTVTLLDKNGNPVVGRAVRLVVIGEAAQVVQADSLSDLQGIVRGYITSTAVGVKIVLAYLMPENLVLEQRGLVEFKRYQAILSLVSGNGQQGIVGQKPAEPLQVRVTSEGNALPGQAVQFIVVSGGGHFNGRDSLIVETDADGLALAEPVLGVIAGMNRFLARLPQAGSPTVTFNVQGMPDMPYALSRIQGENQTASVRMPLPQQFVVAVRDRYNNPCPNTSVFFEALDGGSILTPQPVVSDSVGRAECQAALGTREGRYTFKASLRSGPLVIFTAEAVNSNHPPIIIGKRPFDSLLPFHYGDRLSFEITQVYDPDGDPVSYTWYLNNQRIGSQSSFSLYMNSSFPQTNNVRCVVSDGLDAVEAAWTLVLQTGVELSYFTADYAPAQGVTLKWRIAGNANAGGFNLYRSREQEERKRINATPILPNGVEYRYLDAETLTPGTYAYYLEAVDLNGRTAQVGSVLVTVSAPEQFALQPSYPNPFNPATTITFDLPKEGRVSICIFDGRGRLVRELANTLYSAGRHSLQWDARDDLGHSVPSGIYLVTVTFNGESRSGKLTLLK